MLPEKYEIPVVKKAHSIEVTVPGSKSITNRALLIAALAEGKSVIKGILFSDDSRHFLKALIDLGFMVEIDEDNKMVAIEGCGGKIPKQEASIYVGSAGTAARFLTALLGLSNGRYKIDASEQMKKRPMKELLVALSDMGAQIEYLEEEFHFPFMIGCPKWKKQEVVVDVDKSSQFLSALLISSVLSDKKFKIAVTGTHGMAYVDMTVSMMAQFGAVAKKDEEASKKDTYSVAYEIDQKASYHSLVYEVEPDLSAACYFYAMSPILGVPAKVRGVKLDCMQGDIAFLDVLKKMGCTVASSDEVENLGIDCFSKAEGVCVLPPKDGLKGGCFDLSAFSDQTLTLAAIAPFAKEKVEILKVGHIRLQECDRMEAIRRNLSKMGIDCSVGEDNIVIEPGRVLPCEVETFEDHRVAMAFSIPGLVTEGIVIKNPACCRKTFENYFDVLETNVMN